MHRALTSKNKIRFIDGSLQRPSAYPNFDVWERANIMGISWINHMLSPHIAHNTICFDFVFDLWIDLQERFTKRNHFRFSYLLRNLHSTKQYDRSLSQYFTNVKILWDELGDLRLTPMCACTIPCICNLSKVMRQYKHIKYVTCFLKGLNGAYHNIHTQILLLDHMPNISRVYSLIAQ